jgi:hypothetical protein
MERIDATYYAASKHLLFHVSLDYKGDERSTFNVSTYAEAENLCSAFAFKNSVAVELARFETSPASLGPIKWRSEFDNTGFPIA